MVGAVTQAFLPAGLALTGPASSLATCWRRPGSQLRALAFAASGATSPVEPYSITRLATRSIVSSRSQGSGGSQLHGGSNSITRRVAESGM